MIYYDPSGFGSKTVDYTKIPKTEWPESATILDKITGSPNIPRRRNDFRKWFDSLSSEQLAELYETQMVKDIIKDKLRGAGGNHEWNMVSNADGFKEMGLTAGDIMDNATPTNEITFINIINPNTGEMISGAHTGTSAGSYAHMELDQLYMQSENYEEYVEKVRDWADEHLEGGADALPGYFKRGEELPAHLQEEGDCKDEG